MRRRRTADPPAGSAAGVLLAYERQCAVAAAAGDELAAERLVSVRSWRGMLRTAGDDPQIGALFVAFARAEA